MFYGSNQLARARQRQLLDSVQQEIRIRRSPRRYSLRERSQLLVAEALIAFGRRLRSNVICKARRVRVQMQFH